MKVKVTRQVTQEIVVTLDESFNKATPHQRHLYALLDAEHADSQEWRNTETWSYQSDAWPSSDETL